MKHFKPDPLIIDLEVSEDGPSIHSFEDGHQIAQVFLGPNESKQDQLSYAQLFAGAPELLRTLEAVEGHLFKIGRADLVIVLGIHRALEKARGR